MPSITNSQIMDIASDLFFSDERNVIQAILASGTNEDQEGVESLKYILEQCEKRGLNPAEIVRKAFKEYDDFAKLLGSAKPTVVRSKAFHIPLKVSR